MGTTMVAAAIAGNHLVIGNVGDSRAYLLKEQGWQQVTTDHSYINELVRLGSIREEDIHAPELQRFGPIITRAIGAAEEIIPDFYHYELEDGDALLLCSDGLTRYLDAPAFDNEIDLGDLNAACKHLCDLANLQGGIDNITCILLRYHTDWSKAK
jgi:serine/threonine protein phosphatase PrpC